MPPVDLWLPSRRPRPGARLRLFCFPYAGGGASVYRGFAEGLPPHVEALAVQLPGRETRLREAPIAEMARLVEAIADGLSPHLDLPFAFFGHSMGALIAFDLACALRRRGAPGPVHVFASACPAPHLRDEDGFHLLPDRALADRLRELGGMAEEVLAHRELMEMILPIFRADAALTETRPPTAEPPLDASITALSGDADPKATRADMEAWRRHTRGAFSLAVVPGGHLFLQTARAEVLSLVARALPG